MESESKEKEISNKENELNTILNTATNVFTKLTDEINLEKSKNSNLSTELDSLRNTRELLQLLRSFKNNRNTDKTEELTDTVKKVKAKVEELDSHKNNYLSKNDNTENDLKLPFDNLSRRMEEMNEDIMKIKQQLNRLNRRL